MGSNRSPQIYNFIIASFFLQHHKRARLNMMVKSLGKRLKGWKQIAARGLVHSDAICGFIFILMYEKSL